MAAFPNCLQPSPFRSPSHLLTLPYIHREREREALLLVLDVVTMAAGTPRSSSCSLPRLPPLAFLLLLLLVFSGMAEGRGRGLLRPSDCQPRCSFRCSATSHKKPCMFFCLKCCAQCLCVPPGTYGNKQVCPCYNNWKTKEGGPKCP